MQLFEISLFVWTEFVWYIHFEFIIILWNLVSYVWKPNMSIFITIMPFFYISFFLKAKKLWFLLFARIIQSSASALWLLFWQLDLEVAVESENNIIYTTTYYIFFNMTSWILRTKFIVIYDLPQIVQIRLHQQPDRWL